MTRMQFAGVICWLMLMPATGFADAPHEIGGIELGAQIDVFRKRIIPGSELPLRYLESLKEVEVRKTPGFKTGLVYYGTCETPSRILRIEFKYIDSSKKFYEELLKRFKRDLGEPDEWRGDPFHIVEGWKWKFVDKNGNDISLILKHNNRNEEKKEGNYIKMTMWNLMQKEIRCFQDSPETVDETAGETAKGEIDWNLLVPR